MADRESERDRRVRELLSSDKSGNSGEQMAVLGQSQAEVQDIQSELQNHIALQRAQEDSRLRETQSITQAATGLMAMQQDDLQGQVAIMNPQTQATMGKFGVKPQRSQNTTSNSSSNSSVSRSGNVTNIRNENVTHNTTNIKVTQPQIPVSQPQIPIQQVRRDDGTSKFKAWLSEMFAKQQNEAEIQRKEYRKKEWALGRTTTRLMKRIGEATSNIGNKLDPQVMTSSLGGQLKWLLMIFGATMIAKVWKPTMKFLANLESGFRAVFGLPINQDLRNNTTGTLSIIEQIKSFIGIKKGENTSLIKGIGEVFMQGIDKLIDRLKFWFEDRAKAMRSVEFPKMESSVDFGLLGDVLGPAMEGITDTFRNVAAYLGDLITVAMGGTKGKMKVAARKMSRKAQESFTNTEGKETSFGDSALINGNGRNYMRKSDYDMMGNLKGDAASTQAMSQSLISMINDKSNTGHAVEIATGVSQLFKTAENNGGVVINPDILTYLGLTNKDLVTLKGNGMLKEKQYRIIFVKPSETQRIEHYGKPGSELSDAGGIVGSLLINPVFGFGAGVGVGSQIDEAIWKHGQEDLYPKLVPAESNEMSEDGSPGIPKVMWELTREGARQVTHRLTQGMTNTELDITNREFYDRIIQLEEQYKRRNGVGGNIIQGISDNELRQRQAEYDAYLREEYDRYDSTDPNSYNMQHFYKWNTTYGNVSNLVNQGVSYLSNSMRGAASNLKGESLTPGQELSRQNYLIDRLVQEGLTVEQAAGIAANIRRESNYRTNVAGDRGTSIGIAQWHNERITAYNTKFGAKGPLKDASFPEQVEYLIWEAKQNGTWDAVRSTSSAEEAANMFERKFERSRDYQNEGNATRMRYASEALRSYRTDNSYNQEHILTNYTSQNTSAEPQYQATYFRGESPYEIVPQGGFKVSGSNIIAWIGDSHSQLGLPDTVGKIVKSKLNCEFIWGCKHGFTCNNHLKDDAYSNSSNPSEITKFSDILSKKPSIVIVELGDNDALNSNWQTGVDNLINKIKSIGAKVIWSTPIGYSTKHPEHVNRNAANNKFREYILSRSDIMSIDTGGFIGFYSNSPTVWDQYVSNDNIHWNREGYKKLGEWIGGMLTGEAVTNPRYNQADLETQSNGQNGLWGKMTGFFGSSLEYLANLLGPETEKFILENPVENLTPEQRQGMNKMITQMNMNEYMNIKSWERLGAKIDEKGLYFEQPGGVKVYVKTDGNHNGMFGLRKDDISFLEIPDANNPGEYTGDIDQTSWDLYANSAVGSINSFFVQYEDKTKRNGYYDYVLDKNGNPLGIKLKQVSDYDNFSKIAQHDFNKAKGVRFIIYPTKDFRKWNIDGLNKKIPYSGVHLADEDHMIDNKSMVGWYYGPIIRHKGATWYKPGSTIEEKKYIDIQPLCYLNNVKLTPTATRYATEAITFLYENRFNLSNKLDSGDITETGDLRDNSNFSFGSSDVVRQFAGANSIAVQYDNKILNKEIFNLDAYSEILGIENSIESRTAYYNDHKELFTEIEDKENGIVEIYGPQGLKWGTRSLSDGSIKWLDNSEMGKVSREDLESNITKINRHNSDVFANQNNMISYDSMVDYLSKTNSSSRYGEIKTTGVMQNVGNFDILWNMEEKKLPIYLRTDSDGKQTFLISGIDMSKLTNGGYTKNIEDSSVYGLYQRINSELGKVPGNESAENTPEIRNLGEKQALSEMYKSEFNEFVSRGLLITDIKKSKDKTVMHSDRNVLPRAINWAIRKTTGQLSKLPMVGGIYSKLGTAAQTINNQGWNAAIENTTPFRTELVVATIYLENGTKVVKGGTSEPDLAYFYQKQDLTHFKTSVNNEILRRRKQAEMSNEEKDAAFKPLEAQYNNLAALANSNKMQYTTLDNGYVVNMQGQVFGKLGEDGKTIVALGREEAEKHMIDSLNSSSEYRNAYYKAVLGGHLVTENGISYFTNGNKRIQVNTDTDINLFKTNGLNAIIDPASRVQKLENNTWRTELSNDTNNTDILQLKTEMEQVLANSNSSTATMELLEIYRKQMLDKLTSFTTQSKNQYFEAKRQSQHQEGIYKILKKFIEEMYPESSKELLEELRKDENDVEQEIGGETMLDRARGREGDNYGNLETTINPIKYGNSSIGLTFDKDGLEEGKATKRTVYGTNTDGSTFIDENATVTKKGDVITVNAGGHTVTYNITNMKSVNSGNTNMNGTTPQNAGTIE